MNEVRDHPPPPTFSLSKRQIYDIDLSKGVFKTLNSYLLIIFPHTSYFIIAAMFHRPYLVPIAVGCWGCPIFLFTTLCRLYKYCLLAVNTFTIVHFYDITLSAFFLIVQETMRLFFILSEHTHHTFIGTYNGAVYLIQLLHINACS